MLDKIITPANAILATRYLMELDINAVREAYQRDICHWAVTLKQAQKDYLAYSRSEGDAKNLTTEAIQTSLTKLAQCAKHISALLSDEAKHQLQDWLLMQEHL